MSSPAPHLKGQCFHGPCDGLEFMHTEDMKRVKVKGPDKAMHLYVFHENLTKERGVRTYLWEGMQDQAWKY